MRQGLYSTGVECSRRSRKLSVIKSRTFRIVLVTSPPFRVSSPVNSYRGRAVSTRSVVVVFGYKTRVVLFAVGVGTLAEPILVTRIVAVLTLGEEATLPRLVSTLPAPFTICLCGAGLFLPGVVP